MIKFLSWLGLFWLCYSTQIFILAFIQQKFSFFLICQWCIILPCNHSWKHSDKDFATLNKGCPGSPCSLFHCSILKGKQNNSKKKRSLHRRFLGVRSRSQIRPSVHSLLFTRPHIKEDQRKYSNKCPAQETNIRLCDTHNNLCVGFLDPEICD